MWCAPMAVFLLLLLFLVPTASLAIAQRMLRQIFRRHPITTNPFVALIESPLAGPLAFTSSDGSRIFVDTPRLQESPNTLWNVLRHEVAHTQGQTHANATREMQYAAKQDPQGRILDDDYRI